MADAFVSVVAIQPTTPKISQAGLTSTVANIPRPSLVSNAITAIRSVGVMTK